MKKIGFSIMVICLVLGYLLEQKPISEFRQGMRELVIFMLWVYFLSGLYMIIKKNKKDGSKPY